MAVSDLVYWAWLLGRNLSFPSSKLCTTTCTIAADEMSPTVWTADGLEKQPAAADREKGPIQQFCEDLHNKRAWTAAYVFFTAYALFSIDIDALAGDKNFGRSQMMSG
eukprot:s1206_g1.t1